MHEYNSSQTFLDWLLLFENEKSPIGYLAKDMRACLLDGCLAPDRDSLFGVRRHLEDEHSYASNAATAFESAVRIVSLYEWAEGHGCLTAAVGLLVNYRHGRLLSGPWIQHDDPETYDACVFNPQITYTETSTEDPRLSAEQRRVLQVAMSLVSSKHPVDLGDVMTGIDPKAFVLVAQAIGQAYGLVPVVEPSGSGTEDTPAKEGH